MQTSELQETARRIRLEILHMLHAAQTGHPGGALSMTDLLTVLYFDQMNIRPEDPKWEDRDRFVLSKGHGAPGLYATLAERGYFPKSELKTLRKFKSILQGHPDMKVTPGLDMSSGSLGQGLSIGCGMALAARMNKKDYRVYVIVGDGELQEGQVWEAAMSAAQYKLNHLTLIVDCNRLQINGDVESVMGLAPLDKKFVAFGWNVLLVDGHDIESIRAGLKKAVLHQDAPTVVIANTVKGKGVSYMENDAAWHGSVPDEAQYQQAVAELGGNAQ